MSGDKDIGIWEKGAPMTSGDYMPDSVAATRSNLSLTVFVSPVLLKRKANDITTMHLPLPPYTLSPLPPLHAMTTLGPCHL